MPRSPRIYPKRGLLVNSRDPFLSDASKSHKDDGTFLWRKKYEKEGKGNLPDRDLRRLQRKKRRALEEELQTVKRRREERDTLREERRKEAASQSSSDDFTTFCQEKEEQFFLGQVETRSCIRLDTNRAKPIDHLASYVSTVALCIAQTPVHTDKTTDKTISATLVNISPKIDDIHPVIFIKQIDDFYDLEDLEADIEIYQKLHVDKIRGTLWADLLTLTKSLISKYRPRLERRNEDVEREIDRILADITPSQLTHLKLTVEEKLKSTGIDVAFWQILLSNVTALIAERNVNKVHACFTAFRGITAKTETCDGSVEQPAGAAIIGSTDTVTVMEDFTDADGAVVKCPITLIPGESSPPGSSPSSDCCLNAGTASTDAVPALRQQSLSMKSIIILDPDEDRLRLELARQKVLDLQGNGDKGPTSVGGSPAEPATPTPSSGAEVMDLPEWGTDSTDVEGELESAFGCETEIDEDTVLCDRFTARKPRYYNKVLSGYVWNKYNRSHYDSDNPPPKMVMGYRFNLFYPDLMDKSQVPRFSLTPSGDGLATLRFMAGPPYEDVAFTVVDDEWDKSRRSGYRCVYNGKILQLWFRFKRKVYRR